MYPKSANIVSSSTPLIHEAPWTYSTTTSTLLHSSPRMVRSRSEKSWPYFSFISALIFLL
jgi:hypothetical protein